MLEVNSLYKNKFLIFSGKFSEFSLSGKMNMQDPRFSFAVATPKMFTLLRLDFFKQKPEIVLEVQNIRLTQNSLFSC